MRSQRHHFAEISITALILWLVSTPIIAEEQEDDSSSLLGSFTESEIPQKKSTTAPPGDSDVTEPLSVNDNELIKDRPREDPKAGIDFIGIDPTTAWLERNGLGVHVAIGGLSCSRKYCSNSLNSSIFGSIAGTIGAHYRMNPNLSFFAETTIAHIRTDMNPITTNNTGVDKSKAFFFHGLAGGAFHVPVRGWLDLHVRGGMGPVLLRARAEAGSSDFAHRWGGINIELGLGANLYFWSVGPMQNFSIGPYTRFGFPIWPRVCANLAGNQTCSRPSNQPDPTVFIWNATPFLFHTGIEARYHFGLTFGNTSRRETDGEASLSVSTKRKKKSDSTKNTENADGDWDI